MVYAALEFLIFEALREQVTAIANIGSVFLSDVLGAVNPYVKLLEKRDNDFCLHALGCSRVPRRLFG